MGTIDIIDIMDIYDIIDIANIDTDKISIVSHANKLNDNILTLELWRYKSKKNELLSYRKKLRDITKDFNNPDDVIWPDSPVE